MEKWIHAAMPEMRRLYDYYGTDVFSWLASLYDRDSGMFYYADSARDNEGFLPDVESTAQALNILSNTGVINHLGRVWKNALSEEMCARLLASVQALQSPVDGYFYHPQWGSEIGAARRGRDYSQATELISRMEGRPLYPTALERLESNAAAGAPADSAMPAHLASREAMLAYLEKLDVNHNSYSTGHILSSQASQIKAAGLADFVLDYLAAHQNPQTGLWEEEANYQTLSGVIKIGSLHSALGKAIRHGYEIVDSAIDVILSDADTLHICLVYNPLGGLTTALRSIAQSNTAAKEAGEPEPYDMDAIREKIIARLPEIVDATIAKLEKYHHPDGSFSYFAHRSAPYTQGTYVSLGLNEGDVNGTAVGIHYILNAMWGWFGVSPAQVPPAPAGTWEAMLAQMSAAAPAKKIPRRGIERLDFGISGCIGNRLRTDGNWHFGIQDAPGGGGRALRCISAAGGAGTIRYRCNDPFHPLPAVRRVEWEMELLVREADEGVFGTLCIGAEPPLTLERRGGEIRLGGALYGRVGEWMHLRFSAAPAEDGRLTLRIPAEAAADLYVNRLWGREAF